MNILHEADRLTSTDRNKEYGHPADDFAKTALMLTGLLKNKLKDGESITAGEVPLIQICVKLSRQMNAYKLDNLTDICGYSRTAQMVQDKKDEKLKELADAYYASKSVDKIYKTVQDHILKGDGAEKEVWHTLSGPRPKKEFDMKKCKWQKVYTAPTATEKLENEKLSKKSPHVSRRKVDNK